MTNTELFYKKMQAFQDRRIEIVEAYEKDLENLKRFEGSEGYKEDRKKLDEKHEAELKQLQNEYRPGIWMAFGGMVDAIGRRTVSAPTNDQVNLLNVLKMKRKVTLEECQRVAESVKDNPIAVSLVTEIAHDHGLMHSFDYLCPEMSSQTASDIVGTLKEFANDFLQYDTSKASRVAKEYHDVRYGDSGFKPSKRRRFEDQDSFYYKTLNFTEDSFKLFSDIVNQEGVETD